MSSVVASANNFYIPKKALQITLNALSNKDYLDIVSYNSSKVYVYMRDVVDSNGHNLGRDEDGNNKTWNLEVAPTYFEDTDARWLYLAVSREGQRAILAWPKFKVDVYGKTYTTQDGATEEQLLPDTYFYVKLGKVSSSASGAYRQWAEDIEYGILETDAGLTSSMEEMFLRRDKDDKSLHRYTFKELVLGDALLSFDSEKNALSIKGLPVTTTETYTDEEGNEQTRDVTTTPSMNIYATGGISAFGINPNAGSGSGGSDGSGEETPETETVKGNEVQVSSETPTDNDVELWAKVESGTQTAPFSMHIDDNGNLIVEVEDVSATLKAKYNGSWINVGGGVISSGGSGGSVGSNVSVTALLNSGTHIATIVVDGISYDLYAPVGGSGGVSLGETSSTAYRGDRGKTAYDHSQLKTGNPHGVKYSELSDKLTKSDIESLVGLKSLAYMDESDITTFVKKNGDSIEWLQIGSAKLSWDSTANALKIEGNVYATGGISAYGNNEGGSVEISGVTSLNGNTGALTLKTINGESLLGSGNITITGGSGGDVTKSSIISALGYTPANATNEHTHSNKSVIDGITSTLIGNWNTAYSDRHSHSNKSFLDELISNDVLKSKVGISNYVAKSGDTMTGSLFVNGNTSFEYDTVNHKSVSYSGRFADNVLMSIGKYISWFYGDTTNADGVDMPWYGIGVYQNNGTKMHVSGYGGICMHTSTNYIEMFTKGLKIGNGILTWDSEHSAFYMYNATTGANCNLYATGGISAFGILSSTTLDTLTISGQAKVGSLKIGTTEITDANGIITTSNGINAKSNVTINGLLTATGGVVISNGKTLTFKDSVLSEMIVKSSTATSQGTKYIYVNINDQNYRITCYQVSSIPTT